MTINASTLYRALPGSDSKFARPTIAGLTIKTADVSDDGTLVLFFEDNTASLFTHITSCCESVTITDISGDLTVRDLAGKTIISASATPAWETDDMEDWGSYVRFTLLTDAGMIRLVFRMENECGYAMDFCDDHYTLDDAAITVLSTLMNIPADA